MVKRLPHGALIAFEGIDGAGKTTQAHRLIEAVRAAGVPALYSKEPTEGPWGQKIRRSAEGERMPMSEELEAFIEDRRQHVREIVKPALDTGAVVVLDRYYFSNAAYQGARGADVAEIIARNEEFAPEPDLLVYLDIPVDVALDRVRSRGAVSSFERADLLEKSAAIFQSFQRPYLMQIDGRRSIDDLAGAVMDVVREGILINALEDDAPRLSPERVAAALAEVQRIEGDPTVSAEKKPEAVRRAIQTILGKPVLD